MSEAQTRILFVDDEVAILDGLRDLLRKEPVSYTHLTLPTILRV